MRVVIACALVVLSVLAALGVAQTQNVFSSVTGRISGTSATAATSPEPSAKPIAVAKTQDRPAANALSMAAATPAPTAPVTTAPATTASVSTTGTTPSVSAAPAANVASPAAPAPATAKTAAPAQMPAQVLAQAAPPASRPAPAAAPAQPACANPNGLGVTRTVEIDTTGGPGFGFEHFKQHDFLRPGEVVLTFDDGPWLTNTPAVLAALANHCVKATFFPIGKHATYYPEILKQVADAGHSVGSHTWSHADLSKKLAEIAKTHGSDEAKEKALDEAKTEIELGIAAVRAAAGDAAMPFFRFPALRHPPELVTYLGQRNIAMFSTDLDSFDFKMRKGDQVLRSVMEKLKKHGKGIVLMHDFQHATAEAIPTLLDQLKLNGYKVVHMRAKSSVKSLPQYDAMLVKEQKLPTVSSRPTSDVVKTVNE